MVREVRGRGMFRGVELMRNQGNSPEPFPELGTALKQTAVKNGLIMRIDPNWFAVALPLTENRVALSVTHLQVPQKMVVQWAFSHYPSPARSRRYGTAAFRSSSTSRTASPR